MRGILGLAAFAVSGFAATTVATVGDSFADSIYYGLRARPDLLRANEVELVRWSRPSIGLSRSDQFDYAAWLRDSDDLGTADYCIAQLGTNDLQSIPDGAGKWIRFPGDAWRHAYVERVQSLIATLMQRRCRRIMWVLQPGFEQKKFLAGNRDLLNTLQAEGVASAALLLDVEASSRDYRRDHIHFTGPFALRLADAVLNVVGSWRDQVTPECFACHTRLSGWPRVMAPDAQPLTVRSGFVETAPAIADGQPAVSVVPPKVAAPRVVVARATAAKGRKRRHRA